MKRRILLMVAVCLAGRGMAAGLNLDNVQSAFIEGKQHYENQRFDEAIQSYRSILQTGYYAPELFHNLGNAYFRTGDIGRAILHYRRAQRLAPMDSAIKANIAFAQKQTGAVIAAPPIWHAPIRVLSRDGWLIGLFTVWWIGLLSLSAWLWRGRNAQALKRIWIWSGGLMLVFGAGFILSSWLERQPEVVILADQVEALFAPLSESVAHFSLPEGSVAAMVEQGDSWLKIRSGKESGWIPAEACEATHSW